MSSEVALDKTGQFVSGLAASNFGEVNINSSLTRVDITMSSLGSKDVLGG